MRGVTLKELHTWLEKNKKLTWYIGKMDEGGFSKGGKPLIKYMDLVFDTRGMDIFCIKLRGGFSKEVMVTTANNDIPDTVSILDRLDELIAERVTEDDKRYVEENKQTP